MRYAFPIIPVGRAFAIDPCLVVAFRPGLVSLVHGGRCGGRGVAAEVELMRMPASTNGYDSGLSIDAGVTVVVVGEVIDRLVALAILSAPCMISDSQLPTRLIP